jgi:hypothetical protein
MAARPDFSMRWLGVVSALGVGSACNDVCERQGFEPPPEPDPSPSAAPEVIAGEWIGPGVLELSFSRPLSSLGDLDPNRFAIVGWNAVANEYGTDGECYLQTRYRELSGGSYYYYYQPSGIAAVWIGPEDDTLLRLRLVTSSPQCRSSGDSIATGIMLVYTNDDDPILGEGLRNENGDVVPDLGPAWAISRLDSCVNTNYCTIYYYATGHLPQVSSLAQIPCP